MLELSYEQIETIGAMADKADNLIAASSMPLPLNVHVQCLTSGLKEIRDVLNELHRTIGGECPTCCTTHPVVMTCGEAEAGRA